MEGSNYPRSETEGKLPQKRPKFFLPTFIVGLTAVSLMIFIFDDYIGRRIRNAGVWTGVSPTFILVLILTPITAVLLWKSGGLKITSKVKFFGMSMVWAGLLLAALDTLGSRYSDSGAFLMACLSGIMIFTLACAPLLGLVWGAHWLVHRKSTVLESASDLTAQLAYRLPHADPTSVEREERPSV